MTEKLKVSREVADVLDGLNRKDLNTDTWLKMHSEGEWVSAKCKPLNTLSLEEFARALINGYEVEMTPHELIQKAYKKSNVKRGVSVGLNDMILAGAENGFMNGVEFTLNTLGIKIKGVNDNDN